jgi:hypothetical protein
LLEKYTYLGYISSIIKRHNGELEVKAGNGEQRQREETIDTRVFKLFEEGRTPVHVAIELDLKSDDVTSLYKKWWDLKGLYELNQLYNDRKDDLLEFHAVYKFIKNEGVAPRQLVDAANRLEQLSLLEPRLNNIKNEIQGRESQKQSQMNELAVLRNDITLANQELNANAVTVNATMNKYTSMHKIRNFETKYGVYEEILQGVNPNRDVYTSALVSELKRRISTIQRSA